MAWKGPLTLLLLMVMSFHDRNWIKSAIHQLNCGHSLALIRHPFNPPQFTYWPASSAVLLWPSKMLTQRIESNPSYLPLNDSKRPLNYLWSCWQNLWPPSPIKSVSRKLIIQDINQSATSGGGGKDGDWKSNWRDNDGDRCVEICQGFQ